MKKMCWMVTLLLFCQHELTSQVRWDGGGGNNEWNNPANWYPDGVPTATDEVVLNNDITAGSYSVQLPAGAVTVTVQLVSIFPGDGLIELILPKENTITPALIVSGSGDGLIIGERGILRNSSGATAGDAIQVLGSFRILNGGRYIHNTARGNAAIINQLANDAGTEKGIFEFDVPGAAGYTVSLTGNTFGTLIFAAGNGPKSYSGSGTTTLKINGDLIIKTGATITSTLTADIKIGGNLEVNGTINFNPPSTGTSNRAVEFSGNPGVIKGAGNIQMNSNFIKFLVMPQAVCKLERSLALMHGSNSFEVANEARLETGMHSISGYGTFKLGDNASITLGAAVGIQQIFQSGNICTATRSLSQNATYYFNGVGVQSTGNSFPSSIKNLHLNKSDGQLVLNQDLEVTGSLALESGIILTDDNSTLLLKDAVIESPVNLYNVANSGWEKSFISGPVSVELTGTGKFVVPTGKGNFFAPMILEKENAGNSVYKVEYFSVPYANLYPVENGTLHHVSELEYWQISSANQPADAAKISLSWRPYSAVADNENERLSLRLAYLNNAGATYWQRLGPNPYINGNSEYGFIESDEAVIPQGPFVLASAAAFNILPFRSIGFSTMQTLSGINLKWKVNAEDDLRYYVVQKSENGKHFIAEDTIEALSTPGGRQYDYTDKSPYSGLNFYRIAVRSVNDTTYYSEINAVEFTNSSKIKLFPNPATKEIQIFFPGISSRTECRIVRNNGSAVMKTFYINENNSRIDISSLPSGHYFLLLFKPNGLIALPFLKY